MTNSAASPRSDARPRLRESALVLAFLLLLFGCSAIWFYRNGYVLYYGDAQAHLDLSRSIIDSRTPGYDQFGTVWLPLLHLLCLPFVANDTLWRTGLAGTLPVAVCSIIAGYCFFLAARYYYCDSLAAFVVLSCFVLNPNLLYLSAIPMTEMVFLAGVSILLLAGIRFQRSPNVRLLLMGVAATWIMSLTRYDGWFLIPFAGVFFARSSKQPRIRVLLAFVTVATIAPLCWVAHNWWQSGNALDFFNGPYSAKTIQGGKWYPGYHDWILATRYYAKAGQLCAGWGLIFLGIAGIGCGLLRRKIAPVAFLSLTPIFYIWSMHSSGNPIFVPQLWPHGYYNSRYGIAVVALAAFSAGAIVSSLPTRRRRWSWLLPAIAVLPWLASPSSENWICWKESQQNSISRRNWTHSAGIYLSGQYRDGQGILTTCCGDLTGILSSANIPLREALHEGNGVQWRANISRPDLLHQETWAIARQGDPVDKALRGRGATVYGPVYRVRTKDNPDLLIYRRNDILAQPPGAAAEK